MSPIQNALLSWANTFLDAQVDTYDQLADGHAIATIADQITPGVVNCQASTDDIFSAVLINIYGTDSISAYELSAGNVDALAQLLGALLIAAIQSDSRDMVIRGITQLNGGVQAHLKAVIEGAVIVTAPTSKQDANNGNAAEQHDAHQGAGDPAAAAVAAAAAADAATAAEEEEDAGAVGDAADLSVDQENFNSTAVVHAQKEHRLAEEHMRKRLTTVQDELDDAYALHDEVLLELQGKNKEIDELQFRLQDTEHAVDRVKVLEEELESLQGMEIKFVKMKADSERFKQALEEAKPRLQELASLQKEHVSVTSANRVQTDQIQVLEARVKEYRVRVSSSELKLSELRASTERKDVEMKRLVETRNTLGDEVKNLKMKVTTLESRLANQEAEFAAGAGATNDGQLAEAERLAYLEEECAKLRTELSSKKDFDIEKGSLEDRIADGAAFSDGLEGKIKAQASEIHEHTKVLEDKDTEIEQLQYKLAAAVKEKDAEIEQLNAARSHQASETNSLRDQMRKISQEYATAQVSMKHMEAQLRMSKKQDEKASRRLSFMPQAEAVAATAPAAEEPARAYHNPNPSWWGGDAAAGPNYPSNGTDADRIAELKRRNKARAPHLRSSHALEMQEQKSTSAFWDTLQNSAYTMSPKPGGILASPAAVHVSNSPYRVKPSNLTSQIFPSAGKATPLRKLADSVETKPEPSASNAAAFDAPAVELAMPKGKMFDATSKPVAKKMPGKLAKRMADAKAKKEAGMANAARQKDVKEKAEKEKAAKAKKKKKAASKHSTASTSSYSATGRFVSKPKQAAKGALPAVAAPQESADENVAQFKAKAGSVLIKKGGLAVPGSKLRRKLPVSPSESKSIDGMGMAFIQRGVITPLNGTARPKDPFSCTVKSAGKSTPLRRLDLVDNYDSPLN